VPPADRRLSLRLQADQGQGALTVGDSGPGIAPEVLPRIFEPFFTTRANGLGLGLSLCESLAAGMGGQLAVQPRTPRGAAFTLRLPLATP
jgi:C4-dicarboxylate-specific signal transduction histidine kinase